MLFFMYCDY